MKLSTKISLCSAMLHDNVEFGSLVDLLLIPNNKKYQWINLKLTGKLGSSGNWIKILLSLGNLYQLAMKLNHRTLKLKKESKLMSCSQES